MTKREAPAETRFELWKRFFSHNIGWIGLGVVGVVAVVAGYFVFGQSGNIEGGLPSGGIKQQATNTNAAVEEPAAPQRRIDGVFVSEEKTNSFPVAIMIDNVPGSWPHSGLEAASVLYETLVEGGATRIMAVFAGGEAAKIGPVRSARPYFLEWVSEYDAFYGHVGGSPDALAAIDGLGIKDFSQFKNGKYFWRDTARPAPHNVYTSHELTQLALRDNNYTEPTEYESWLFKDEAEIDSRGASGSVVEIRFSNGRTWTSRYVYNRDTNSYAKFLTTDTPHIDGETGNQLQAKNVVVIVIPEISAIGEKGRLTLDISGSGKAFLFRDGQKIEATWKKADRLARTRLYDAVGNEIEFNRGTTWVSIVPVDRPVLYTEAPTTP